MGTSGTENGRPGRNLRLGLDLICLSQHTLPNHIGAILSLDRKQFLAHCLQNSPGFHLLLNHRFQFFKYVQPVHPGGKFLDQFPGKGMNQSQLQHTGIRHGFPHILVGNPAGDKSHRQIPVLCPVDGHPAGILRHLFHPRFHCHMTLNGIGRHHYIFTDIPFIRYLLPLCPLFQFHQSLGMGQSGSGTHHHRSIIFLTQFKGHFHIFLGLSAVPRLQHRNHGRPGHHPAVLLILGTVHPRVVGGYYHQAAAHTGIGRRKKRIRRHIHSHMLHAAHGADAGNGGTDGHLGGHLFVGGPFRINLVIFCNALADLCAGSTGISRRYLHSRLISTSCYGLIAKQYPLLRHVSLLLRTLHLSVPRRNPSHHGK